MTLFINMAAGSSILVGAQVFVDFLAIYVLDLKYLYYHAKYDETFDIGDYRQIIADATQAENPKLVQSIKHIHVERLRRGNYGALSPEEMEDIVDIHTCLSPRTKEKQKFLKRSATISVRTTKQQDTPPSAEDTLLKDIHIKRTTAR
eukprot:UN05302